MSSGSFARTMIPSASPAHLRKVSGCASGAVISRTWGARMASPSGCIGLVSRTTGLSGIGHGAFGYGIDQPAELFDLDLTDGARLQPGGRLMHPGDAGRRAGRNDIARLQRLPGRK